MLLRLLRWRKTWSLLRRNGRFIWRGISHAASPWWLRLTLVLLLAYMLSPIDLLPDWIFFVGWLDDVLIASLLLQFVRRRLPTHLRLKLDGGAARKTAAQ